MILEWFRIVIQEEKKEIVERDINSREGCEYRNLCSAYLSDTSLCKPSNISIPKDCDYFLQKNIICEIRAKHEEEVKKGIQLINELFEEKKIYK